MRDRTKEEIEEIQKAIEGHLRADREICGQLPKLLAFARSARQPAEACDALRKIIASLEQQHERFTTIIAFALLPPEEAEKALVLRDAEKFLRDAEKAIRTQGAVHPQG